jgi:alpha-amylase
MSSQPSPTPKHMVLYFQAHQPWRLRPFHFFEIGSQGDGFDNPQNEAIVHRVTRQCYLPANKILLDLIKKFPQVKITFSISGTLLDQLKQYCPEALASFKALAETGSVEFLAETDFHSLASLLPGTEFEEQVLDHVARLQEYLGVHPVVFRNTELIYNNDMAKKVHALGFHGMFLDGIDAVLQGKSPNHLYEHPEEKGMKLFPRNYFLSDDIAFRYLEFGKKLTVGKFMARLKSIPQDDPLITLGLDYETFGEHYKEESGILNFLGDLLACIAKDKNYKLVTPSEAIRQLQDTPVLNVPDTISWADAERDLSAWLGNDMQQDAFETMAHLEGRIKAMNDADLTDRWRRLMTSDHFYYMSTKRNSDGNVHAYFSPYASPYEAFMNYMNVLQDFLHTVREKEKELATRPEKGALKAEAERREMHTPIWAMKLENSYEK